MVYDGSVRRPHDVWCAVADVRLPRVIQAADWQRFPGVIRYTAPEVGIALHGAPYAHSDIYVSRAPRVIGRMFARISGHPHACTAMQESAPARRATVALIVAFVRDFAMCPPLPLCRCYAATQQTASAEPQIVNGLSGGGGRTCTASLCWHTRSSHATF